MVTYLFDRTAHQGRIELTDRDRLDLLHRMSTNDMNNLKAGEGRSTVLTTALARIIDRVVVYHRGETALMLANQPVIVRSWLQRHIFFQDKIKLRDVSADLVQLEFHGPQAAQIAETIAVGASALELHHFSESTRDNKIILVARTFSMNGDGFIFIAPNSVSEPLRQSLLAHEGVTLGSDAQYDQLRIQAGLPAKDHELTEDYIPLEANLWDSVSFSKGCYIGQEIIARMESRNRLAKTLVQLSIHADEIDNEATLIGATLHHEDQLVGSITSIAQIGDSQWAALGFVKPDSATFGTKLSVKIADEQAKFVTAEVSGELKPVR
jgi:tRNA-modifying protein YgfZ